MRPHAVICYGLVVVLVMLGTAAPAEGQAKTQQVNSPTIRKPRVRAQHARRFAVEQPISLTLTGCRGDINLPAVSFNVEELEIEGSKVTLTSNDGTTVTGSVIAYARSAYYVDSNIGLTFNKSDLPITNPGWKPPTVISLVLIQFGQK